jgi:hypothetical protein
MDQRFRRGICSCVNLIRFIGPSFDEAGLRPRLSAIGVTADIDRYWR